MLQRRFASADRYPALQRERLTLPDGDFLDLDYTSPPSAMPAGTPLILLLHGLEGSSESGYARGLLRVLQQRGWVGIVMHFRGCSGEPNRLRRSYNAGDSGDLAYVIDTLRARWLDSPLAAVGYSLGGNVLLKWLAEQGSNGVLQAAAAVSVPFRLADAARRMQQGLSRLYQWHLLRSLRASYRAKFASRDDAPVPFNELSQLRDFSSSMIVLPHHYTVMMASRTIIVVPAAGNICTGSKHRPCLCMPVMIRSCLQTRYPQRPN
ncbi:MAG: alpha/beta fold hydrolase [Gammaproteobacteria bacterium]